MTHPRFWGLVALAAASVGLWFVTRWPELLGVAAGCVALLAVALLLGLFRPPRSAAWEDIEAPVRVERGSDAAVVIAITVEGSSRWVSARGAGESSWVGRSPFPTTVSWPIDTSRRGSYLVGPSTLEFADPFGLRRRVLCSRDLSPVLVVPKVSPVPTVAFAGSETEGALVERAGVEQFHSVREYVTGDPMKLVHWKATARTGTLMVRRLVDTTTPTLLVVLDSDEASYQATGSAFHDFSPELFESAVDLAASYAWQHATADHHVLLTTLTPGAALIDVTARTRASCLDWLATVEPTASGASPARIVETMRRRPAGAIVLVTGPHARVTAAERSWSRWAPVTVVRAA